MPTPGALSPIQRVPSGFPGPGGIGFWPFAHGEAGGYHHGFLHLTAIVKRPSGVGYALCPVATWKARANRVPLYRYSSFRPRWITITGPKVRRVTLGLTTRWTSRTVSRADGLSTATMSRTARRWSR